MIIKTKEFQVACKTILDAVDSSKTNQQVSDALELICVGGRLSLNVTNREYFVKVELGTETTEDFKATVNAKLFLSLVAKITTEDIEITVSGNSLLINANGVYKLPMMFNNDKLLELQPIVIDNVTSEFVMPSSTLLSIFKYNSKELSTRVDRTVAQELYYFDSEGCITWSRSACVNTFHIDSPIKVLLKKTLVKLFKLFSSSEEVKVTLGYDQLGSGIVGKIRFRAEDIELTSLIDTDESLMRNIPVGAIRGRVEYPYLYSVNVSRSDLIQAIDRLLIFSSSTGGDERYYASFFFDTDKLVIKDLISGNNEEIEYVHSSIDAPFETTMNLDLMDTLLQNSTEDLLTINFGATDTKALVIARGTVKNILPEVLRKGR